MSLESEEYIYTLREEIEVKDKLIFLLTNELQDIRQQLIILKAEIDFIKRHGHQ